MWLARESNIAFQRVRRRLHGLASVCAGRDCRLRRLTDRLAIGWACERKVYFCPSARLGRGRENTYAERACVCAARRRRPAPGTAARYTANLATRTIRSAVITRRERRRCVTWIAAGTWWRRSRLFGGRGEKKGTGSATNMTRTPARTVRLPAGNIILLVYEWYVLRRRYEQIGQNYNSQTVLLR